MVAFALGTDAALHGLVRLTHHDYYTYTHSVNVGLYSLAIAMSVFDGQSDHDIHQVAAAFFLHDIGKCRLPKEIITKPGSLDEREWEEMKRHPVYGEQTLRQEGSLTSEARIVVLDHHEQIDGLGYPRGLGGDEVHVYARICCVADVFDALTTRRPYGETFRPFEALKVMQDSMPGHFDPAIFEALVVQLGQPAK